MVTATVRYGRQPGSCIMSLTARGHAGYRHDGNDIVCASVSMVFQGLAEAARQLVAERAAEEFFATGNVIADDGAEISLRVKEAGETDARGRERVAYARALFWQAQVSLTMLSEAYPEHVALMVM